MSKYDDAIARLEALAENAAKGFLYLPPTKKAETINDLRAIELAIESLREAAEREKGCEYCTSALAPLYKISTNGHPSFELFEPVFCPMCGRALTKEANE